MTWLESVVSARASLEMAAFFVTWAAVALLVVIIVHLHVRLQRLERASAPVSQRPAYSQLIGQRVTGAADSPPFQWPAGVILFVSPACPACDTLLAELRETPWTTPFAVAVTTPPVAYKLAPLPPMARLLDDGAVLSAVLGIHVTPFAIRVGENGIIEDAAPVSSAASLRLLDHPARSATPTTALNRTLEEVTP